MLSRYFAGRHVASKTFGQNGVRIFSAETPYPLHYILYQSRRGVVEGVGVGGGREGGGGLYVPPPSRLCKSPLMPIIVSGDLA